MSVLRSYTSCTHLNASSGLSEAALTACRTEIFQLLYVSGLGKSGSFTVSASLAFGLSSSGFLIAAWRPGRRYPKLSGAFAQRVPLRLPGHDGPFTWRFSCKS